MLLCCFTTKVIRELVNLTALVTALQGLGATREQSMEPTGFS